MTGRLDGKVALVTGAARGTGAAIARRFVEEGARVVVADVLDERAAATVADLGEAATYRRLDVTSEEDWAAAVTELDALDVLVNNAAVLHLSAIEDTSPETFERVFRVNCFGPFLGTRACLPLLRASGRGSIVNIGSINSLHSMPATVAYTAAKFGLRGLTKATALEEGKHSVRANLVCPVGGNWEMHLSLVGTQPDLAAMTAAPAEGRRSPMRSPARADGPLDLTAFAEVAVFLASDESRYCSGSEFVADRGMSAGPVIDIPGVWSSTVE